MLDGFVNVAAATVDIHVADCDYNAGKIMECIKEAQKEKVKVIVFPELCITGYTCSDLFLQDTLLNGALAALFKIAAFSADIDMLAIVGLPIMKDSKLYNCAAVLKSGRILGIVPKTFLPNYNEFYEARHFNPGPVTPLTFTAEDVPALIRRSAPSDLNCPFYSRILFKNNDIEGLTAAVEICEDLWVPDPPSSSLAMAGATLICNLSASDEITGKSAYRRNLVAMQSARLVCAYAYADAGNGESTTDIVFAGHNIIAENGNVLAESRRFANTLLISQVDINRLNNDRRRMTTYKSDAWKASEKNCFVRVPFSFTDVEETALTRYVDPHPFVPSDIRKREERCEEIINIQAYGLKKRLEHTNTKTVTVGISGGLDSTLALLVTRKAFELAGLPLNGIIAVTMPCFGTTDRTYNNAVKLVNTIGATLKEIRINEAVTIHLRDIGHPFEVHDVTYENAQARERTQILMDVANETGGFVIGTGDLSELALGWATYNGDHMSMYGVNASVPKTLVRYLVAYFANEEKNLSEVLNDVLDTPVSPELLPPLDGMISQKTEDIVGPYELHDFFLYYVLRYGFTPSKIYRLAKQAFSYDTQTILKWLKDFYKRFFAQQFKRSCLPDGPKVGTVAVSPRGDLRMPSDASVNMWIKEIDNLK